MFRSALGTLSLVVFSVLGGTGCAGDESAPTTEDPIIKKTGDTSTWSYRGIMPELESPTLTVSLTGHTVHVQGLLPTSYTKTLPFHAVAEKTPEGRTRVHVAYPIATVAEGGTTPEGLPTRNPEPFTYKICGGENTHATNKIGSFAGFPFIQYVCEHPDADGRVRDGIAFHGPITSLEAEGSDYWSLKRGPVSHACNRMLGEHVLELAHIIGFEHNPGVTPPVKVIKEFDSFRGKKIDVDYASTNWTRPSAAESFVFPVWQAVKLRGDGSVEVQFPQWACETSRCASMPPNAYDAVSGAKLARP